MKPQTQPSSVLHDLPPSYLSIDQQNAVPDQSNVHIPLAAGGPPLLPPLVRGQQIQSGPYTITVTNSMVLDRERQNQEIYRFWLAQQRRNLGGAPEDEYFAEFKNNNVRRRFIRRVFLVLFAQLTFTVLYVAFFMFYPPAQAFIDKYWYLWVIAMTLFICSYCSISITDCGRTQSRWGGTCLVLLTLAESHIAAYISIRFEVEVVLITLAMTATIILIIAFSATICKFDFTMWTGLLSIIGLGVMITLIILVIVLIYTEISILMVIFGALGALIFSLYLYFDIQTIMGGRKIQLSPDEIIFATTQLYVDIIGLYRYLLIVIGGSTRT
ncbi:protein lifeguard 3-like [Chelonus insularis]|uniref:protein lifeguard 3-like n=1 Tax=Chelonus insularis TaxID=460826 RepID=UPI001588EAB7|nr:protein lifeguard 3-like [Chelonus insularis]